MYSVRGKQSAGLPVCSASRKRYICCVNSHFWRGLSRQMAEMRIHARSLVDGALNLRQ